MKILTWNCNQGIGNDFSAIKEFDADVVIIQECEKLDKNSFEGYSSHWIGTNDRKGLAVLTRAKSEFQKANNLKIKIKPLAQLLQRHQNLLLQQL